MRAMPAQIDVPVGAVPEGWGHARLMPTFGIRNQQEQEKRATSCLLAVMHGVPEFGYALLKELDAPKAPVIETFAEVRFKDANGKTVIPDGAIVCRRGKKTGPAWLRSRQGRPVSRTTRSTPTSISRRPTGLMACSLSPPRSPGAPRSLRSRSTGASFGAACGCRISRGGACSPRRSFSSATAAFPIPTRNGFCAN